MAVSQRSYVYALALGVLLLFVFLVITILIIRATFNDPDTRERGIIALYLVTGFAFLLALFAFICAEQTPLVCVLPCSGQLALYQGERDMFN